MKEKNKDLETRNAMMVIELEDALEKHKAMENINLKLEDDIEEVYKERREVTKQMDIISGENESLKTTVSEIKDAKKDISNKFDQYKKKEQAKFTEQCDMINILETTLDNKNSEIEKLKQKLEDSLSELKIKETPATLNYPCTFCDFKDSDEIVLKKHVEETHTFKCDVCDFNVQTKEKLKRHICRIYMKNPEHKTLYLKNWIVAKSCSTVFCKQKRREVSILHSEACLDFRNSCDDLPAWY